MVGEWRACAPRDSGVSLRRYLCLDRHVPATDTPTIWRPVAGLREGKNVIMMIPNVSEQQAVAVAKELAPPVDDRDVVVEADEGDVVAGALALHEHAPAHAELAEEP